MILLGILPLTPWPLKSENIYWEVSANLEKVTEKNELTFVRFNPFFWDFRGKLLNGFYFNVNWYEANICPADTGPPFSLLVHGWQCFCVTSKRPTMHAKVKPLRLGGTGSEWKKHSYRWRYTRIRRAHIHERSNNTPVLCNKRERCT